MRRARPRAAAALLAGAGLMLAGCPDERPGIDKSEEDRTLIKLQEAKEKGPGPGQPPGGEAPWRERLANLAAGGETGEGGPRPLPANNPTVHLGEVAIKLVALSTAPQLSGGKLTLSTDQTFLVVRLLAQNVGKREAELELAGSALLTREGELSIARDAQRVAGTRELHQKLEPGEAGRAELVLVFELPPALLGSGLVLTLRSPGADPVKLPLE